MRTTSRTGSVVHTGWGDRHRTQQGLPSRPPTGSGPGAPRSALTPANTSPPRAVGGVAPGRGGGRCVLAGASLPASALHQSSVSLLWESMSTFKGESRTKCYRKVPLFEVFLPLKNQTSSSCQCLRITRRGWGGAEVGGGRQLPQRCT